MTLKIGNWIIQFRAYKKVHPKPNHGACGALATNGPKVAFDGRYFYIADAEGYIIENQVACTIHDHVNERTTATVKVNISGMTEYKRRQ